METNRLSFIATGDIFITRHIANEGYEGFDELQACIRSHDVRFTNLEMTFHNQEGCPAAESGGTWAMTDPEMLDDVKRLGFNLFNTANNHSGDYSEGGVLATIRHLRERGMIFSGTGRNLAEASRACYLETRGNRVALISTSATFSPASRAGGQTDEMQGRPGLNPLRHKTYYHVDKEHFQMAKELADLTCINADRMYSIRTGYLNPYPDGVQPFGNEAMFLLDDHNWIESVPHEQDLKRITDEVCEAKRQADVVLVSFHAHEYDETDTTVPAKFLELFSRACIDAGADAVIGHGPHELRGIEIYREKPIFYSVGNFLFETDTVALQPYDAYVNKELPVTTRVGSYMDDRSQNGKVGFGTLSEIWNAVMPSWTMENGRLSEIRLYPVELNQHAKRPQRGLPYMNRSEETLRYLSRLCKPYGTEIEIRDGVGYVRL